MIKNIFTKIHFHVRDKKYRLHKSIRQNSKTFYRIFGKLFNINLLEADKITMIPIIIINFNRLDCLLKQIKKLESLGLNNIRILDNNSTYPPLLEYYGICPYIIHRLDKNMEFEALWTSGIFEKYYKNQYYVLTDPDVIPDDTCPDDFLVHFYNLLQKYSNLDKVGFSLKIDDLPDYYDKKCKVIDHESQFWKKLVNNDYYDAPIDTTFALYRPNEKGGAELRAGRTKLPYIAKHLPWYSDSSNPDDETLYYRQQAIFSKNWT
jgi:hypothetical protein